MPSGCGYYYTGAIHPTALIPMWFGLALGVCGFLAISPSESRRKLFMHINVTSALLGFSGPRHRHPGYGQRALGAASTRT